MFRFRSGPVRCVTDLSRPAVASLLMGTAAFAQSGSDAKRFVFNNGIHVSPGLNFVFSRPAATVNPAGEPVGPDMPRYASEFSIAGAAEFQQVRHSNVTVTLLASGLDHDGVTPLLLAHEAQANSLLDVFTADDDELLRSEQTGTGRIRSTLISGDIMNGKIPGKRYGISSAVVCHGLIVVFCTVSIFENNTWKDAANAFVTSQDQGRTWSIAYESPPFAVGAPRGTPWTMQNWWPITRDASPTEAFFAATDYCYNPGSPGGRLYLMRATRPGPDRPWTMEPGTIAFESNVRGVHTHAGGVIPYGENGIRAFIGIGDTQIYNRVVSLISHDGDYTSGKWEIQPEYHGAAGKIGTEGNQFVGCAPGPTPRTVLAGADLFVEQVMLLTMNEEDAHPHTRRLAGFSTLNMTRNNVFSIRTPTPERGGPYCANTEPFFFLPPPFRQRTLYSPDGIHWAQAASAPSGYPIIHGSHIYFDGAPGQGILRIPIPALATGQPLIIGPGGLQQSRAQPDISSGNSSRITPLTRDVHGRWTDGPLVLDPQPPSLGPVYKVQTSSLDVTPLIARIYPATLANNLTRIMGDQLQTRVWLRHLDNSRTATLNIGFGNTVHPPEFYRGVIMPSTTSWVPVTVAQPIYLGPYSTLQLYVRCAGEICNDQTMYLALDAVSEGRGMSGYPMPPDTSSPAVGTAHPDESAKFTDLAFGKEWTVTLAMQIPEDGFDFTSTTQNIWPLATLRADARNYMNLYVNLSAGVVGAHLILDGRPMGTLTADAGTMVRGGPILLSIAQTNQGKRLELTAACSGRGLATTGMSINSSSIVRTSVLMPTELSFSSPSSIPTASGRGAAVSPLLIWGGQFNETQALPASQREQMLRTLSFITQPLP